MRRSDTPNLLREIYWGDLYHQLAGDNKQKIYGKNAT
jgi:hypothetical protein